MSAAATLHPDEAIIPLSAGRSVPVKSVRTTRTIGFNQQGEEVITTDVVHLAHGRPDPVMSVRTTRITGSNEHGEELITTVEDHYIGDSMVQGVALKAHDPYRAPAVRLAIFAAGVIVGLVVPLLPH